VDRDSILKQLKAWADGVDPATGTLLPPDHPAQQPDLLRVVFATLALVESLRLPAGPSPGGLRLAARNAGRPWSDDDDQALATAFDAGQTVAALANRFERTRGSIHARLVRLGKAEAPAGLRLRGPVAALPGEAAPVVAAATATTAPSIAR